MPARPRWLLAIPDAIRQLDTLDRDLLTRRDLKRLFGVSKVRAVALMTAFRGEATRRDRVVTAIRQTRLTGIRVAVPGRIEVRFSGAKDAVGRLFALAQALTNDYEQFEALVDGATPGAAGER